MDHGAHCRRSLAQFDLNDDVYVSASRSHRLPLDGTELEVVSPKTVQFADNGAPAAPVRLAAPTVGEFLKVHNVALEQADSVSLPHDAALEEGMEIVVTRDRVDSRTETLPIEAPQNRVDDPNMTEGETALDNPVLPVSVPSPSTSTPSTVSRSAVPRRRRTF